MNCEICKDTGLFKWSPALPVGVMDFLYCIMPCSQCSKIAFKVSERRFRDDVIDFDRFPEGYTLGFFLKKRGWNVNSSTLFSVDPPDEYITVTSEGTQFHWKRQEYVKAEEPKPQPTPKQKRLIVWHEDMLLSEDYEYYFLRLTQDGRSIELQLVDDSGKRLLCGNVLTFYKTEEGYLCSRHERVNENAPLVFDNERQIKIH